MQFLSVTKSADAANVFTRTLIDVWMEKPARLLGMMQRLFKLFPVSNFMGSNREFTCITGVIVYLHNRCDCRASEMKELVDKAQNNLCTIWLSCLATGQVL
jgi:hypothetical protein